MASFVYCQATSSLLLSRTRKRRFLERVMTDHACVHLPSFAQHPHTCDAISTRRNVISVTTTPITRQSTDEQRLADSNYVSDAITARGLPPDNWIIQFWTVENDNSDKYKQRNWERATKGGHGESALSDKPTIGQHLCSIRTHLAWTGQCTAAVGVELADRADWQLQSLIRHFIWQSGNAATSGVSGQ